MKSVAKWEGSGWYDLGYCEGENLNPVRIRHEHVNGDLNDMQVRHSWRTPLVYIKTQEVYAALNSAY